MIILGTNESTVLTRVFKIFLMPCSFHSIEFNEPSIQKCHFQWCVMRKNVSRTVLRFHLEKWINPLGQLCDTMKISCCNVDKHSQLLFECSSSQLELFCYGRWCDQLFWERAFWIFAPWHIFTNCTSLKVLFLDWGLNELYCVKPVRD